MDIYLGALANNLSPIAERRSEDGYFARFSRSWKQPPWMRRALAAIAAARRGTMVTVPVSRVAATA